MYSFFREQSANNAEYYDNLVRQFVALSTPLVAQPLALDNRTAELEDKNYVAKFMETDIQEQDIERLYSVTNSDSIDSMFTV